MVAIAKFRSYDKNRDKTQHARLVEDEDGVFFFVIRHSFTIEDLVSAPNLKLGCAVILRGCASDYK